MAKKGTVPLVLAKKAQSGAETRGLSPFLATASYSAAGSWKARLGMPIRKVLLCHNYYQQPGGEDSSFDAEAGLLEAHGHEVLRFTRHNDAIVAWAAWT